MRWEQSVEYAYLSDIGFRRQNNQDSCVVNMAQSEQDFRDRGHVLVVADGMGGHAVGELASKLAVDTVPLVFRKLLELPGPDALRQAIVEANDVIHDRGQRNREFENMGTTCTSLVLSSYGAFIGHVGDTRVYRVRENRIDQLTFDHSLNWEMKKRKSKKDDSFPLEGPRNVITRCLGPESSVQVDLEGPFPIVAGDSYVLCTDGLTGLVTDEEIGMVAKELAPGDACRLLVSLANLRGGNDNITVVIARIGKAPPGLPPPTFPEFPLAPVTQSSPASWFGIIALVVVGLFLTLILYLFLNGQEIEATITSGLLVLIVGGMLLAWMRLPPQTPIRKPVLTETVLWKPHRTASARMDQKFSSYLHDLTRMLERTAVEESWEVEWASYHAAMAAATEPNGRQSLKLLADALQVLMSYLTNPKKRADQVAKWRAKSISNE